MRSKTESAVGSVSSSTMLAVGEEHRTVGVRRGDRVVRDHHDRLTELTHGLTHEGEDLGARAGVEVAGGLVGEDDVRLARECARHGDALLLTTRELRRTVTEAVDEADGVDDVVDPCVSGLRPASRIGSVMFSTAVSVGIRLNAWKMKPTRSRRSCVSFLSLSGLRSVSPIHTEPLVSVSRPASVCMSVDLPEPDGPMIAVKRPVAKSTVTPSSARTSASPLPYTLEASTARAATAALRWVSGSLAAGESECHWKGSSVASPSVRAAAATMRSNGRPLRRPGVAGRSVWRRLLNAANRARVHLEMYAGVGLGMDAEAVTCRYVDQVEPAPSWSG